MNQREQDIDRYGAPKTAYDIIVEAIGRHAADDLVADLAEAGFCIIPQEDEATEYEIANRQPA